MKAPNEKGQALVYVAISITVIVFVVIYFLSPQAKDNAQAVSEALQKDYSSASATTWTADDPGTLHDFEKNPGALAKGSVFVIGQTIWYCKDGNMYITNRFKPTEDWSSPGCPKKVSAFKQAVEFIRQKIYDAVNTGTVPEGVDWRIIMQGIDQILYWL